MATTTKGKGRPTKANEQIKKDVLSHMALGLTVEETARLLHIAKSTIYEWTKTDKYFSNDFYSQSPSTIQQEVKKQVKSKDMVKLLVKKAKGFHYTETKRVYDGDNVLIQTTKQEKYSAPDVEAMNKLIELSGDNIDKETASALTINFVRKSEQETEASSD